MYHGANSPGLVILRRWERGVTHSQPWSNLIRWSSFWWWLAWPINCLNFGFEPELMGSIAHSRKGFPQAGAGTSCTVPCYLGHQTHQSRRSQGLLYCVLDLRFRPLPQVLFLLFLCSRCTTVTAFNMCIPNMGWLRSVRTFSSHTLLLVVHRIELQKKWIFWTSRRVVIFYTSPTLLFYFDAML